MSSSKQNLSIGLGVLGIAVAFFFPYDKLSKPKPVVEVIPVTAMTSAPAPAAAKPQAPHESMPNAALIQKRREESNSAVYNGLKEIKTITDGSSLKISIRTKTEPKSCQAGDFDLIKSLVNNVNDKIFLLSLEKLRGRSEKPTTTRLNLFEIMKGDLHTFTLPKPETAQEYGVYLCIDTEKTNSCNQKAALNVKDWNKVINRPKLPSNILYFQLLTTKNSRTYLIPVEKWSSSAIASMKDNLKGWLSRPEETLELTAALMTNLGSLPGQVNEGNLEIPLPYRDPRCDTKASVKPRGNRGGG